MFSQLKRKKGFSLAEVVVSLGVTATVMVVAISLTGQSLRLTKENEVENTANEILIQSLEFIKSPVAINISSSVTGQNAQSSLTGSYTIATSTSLGGATNGNEVGTTYLKSSTASTAEMTQNSCIPGSAEYSLYKVDLQNSTSVVCNQVILTLVPGETDTYKITSIIAYEIGGERVVDRAEAFRKGNFNIVPIQ